MTNQTKISKAQAIRLLEETEVFARMKDGSEKRVGAIAWTKWGDPHATVRHMDEIQYFFTKN